MCLEAHSLPHISAGALLSADAWFLRYHLGPLDFPTLVISTGRYQASALLMFAVQRSWCKTLTYSARVPPVSVSVCGV